MRATLLVLLAASVSLGCEASSSPRDGGSSRDATPPPLDGGADAGATDAGRSDAEPGDAGPADAGPADAGPPCTEPPGAACNPIVVDTFPFRHEGDTSASAADAHDEYACAPGVDEQGPEVHYELRLSDAARLDLALEEASGVDVDLHILRADDPATCLARANTTLEQPLGAGSWRLIVDTYHGGGADLAGPYVLSIDATDPTPTSLGSMWNTYYFVADEDDHEGPADTPIYDAGCTEIARVREGFHDSVCIEGSGRLSDERIINYATACTSSCPEAHLCGSESYRICYSVLDPERYPWGQGAGGRALEPDRSMAVDPDFVALGSRVYFEELDGLVPPGGSTPHDGCLHADDVGGAIDGNHFDFFVGTRDRWLAWEEQLPTRSTLTAWLDDPRCYPTP